METDLFMLMERILGFSTVFQKSVYSLGNDFRRTNRRREGRPGASKEKHVLPEKLKGQPKYHKDCL